MNIDTPIPRVGAQQLPSMIGKKVLFVGRVETGTDTTVHLQSPDGGRVVVQAREPFDSVLVEVEGTVVDGQTIQEDSHVHLGEAFDMVLYNDLLRLTNDTYVDLFRPRAMA